MSIKESMNNLLRIFSIDPDLISFNFAISKNKVVKYNRVSLILPIENNKKFILYISFQNLSECLEIGVSIDYQESLSFYNIFTGVLSQDESLNFEQRKEMFNDIETILVEKLNIYAKELEESLVNKNTEISLDLKKVFGV